MWNFKSTHSKNNSVAYLQVRDVSENQNEKVFIFNGWTFSSNPSLASIDHAIYDIWLVGCESVKKNFSFPNQLVSNVEFINFL